MPLLCPGPPRVSGMYLSTQGASGPCQESPQLPLLTTLIVSGNPYQQVQHLSPVLEKAKSCVMVATGILF